MFWSTAKAELPDDRGVVGLQEQSASECRYTRHLSVHAFRVDKVLALQASEPEFELQNACKEIQAWWCMFIIPVLGWRIETGRFLWFNDDSVTLFIYLERQRVEEGRKRGKNEDGKLADTMVATCWS